MINNFGLFCELHKINDFCASGEVFGIQDAYYEISKGTAFLDKSVSGITENIWKQIFCFSQFYNQPIRAKNHKHIIVTKDQFYSGFHQPINHICNRIIKIKYEHNQMR